MPTKFLVLKRAISALIAAVFALVGTVAAVTPSHAATDRQITIHYHRYAGDYTDWNMWLWAKDVNNGAAYHFTGTDAYGVTGTFTVPASAGKAIGFIVRTDAWKKDVSADRYVTDFDANGNAEIWLLEGASGIYFAAPNIQPTIRSVSANGFNQLKVTLSQALTIASGDNGFTLSGVQGAPLVTSVDAADGTSTSTSSILLNLDSNLVFGNNYTLDSSTYGSAAIDMGSLFDSQQFADQYTYTGDDLGNTYTANSTAFRVWAPTATAVDLLTLADANTLPANATVTPMTKDVNGTWVATLSGDQNLTQYLYRVHVNGTVNIANDPYARASTVNGGHSVVVNLAATDPAGFATETKPAFSGNASDATIYELHVRDFSIDPSSGISAANRGKYLAFTETNTHTPDGKTLTGISYIKSLGVTHVELLPVFDFASVNELSPSFNWGYDPENYNVPEGSYSSDPTNPVARITELKQAIQAMHAQGLRVNMDVVYNHVSSAEMFSENLIVPGYWFRHEADGSLANGTGVGNEVASERPMVRKFIVDSVAYWASQYHFDGFRFDLMGILDTTTMNAVRAALDSIDKTDLIIGEGWNMGDVLPDAQKADQPNLPKMTGIAAFNDSIRDGLKGSVFNSGDKGWATGKSSAADAVKGGIVGETPYSALVTGSWGATQPVQSVNYVECHDNLTLWDKLAASTTLSKANATKMDQMIGSVVVLAQGIPFQQAGQEFLRSKGGNDNSYNAGDAVNSLKWGLAGTNAATVKFYAGLYALRAAHPAFRLTTTAQVQQTLKFVNQSKNVIAYSLNGKAAGDKAGTIFVAHNPNKTNVTVKLPATGTWSVLVSGSKAGTKVLAKVKGKTAVVPAYGTLVLTK